MYNRLEKERQRNLAKIKAKGLSTIRCELCQFECRRLNIHLRKVHALTEEAYLAQFPTAPLYASGLLAKAGETRSEGYKSGRNISYRAGRTAENCLAIKQGAEKLSEVKKGKLIPHLARWNKGLPSWNSSLAVDHPYRDQMSTLATARMQSTRHSKFLLREDLVTPKGNKIHYTPDFRDIEGLFFDGFIELKGYDRDNLRKWLLLREQHGVRVVCILENSVVWKTIHTIYSQIIPMWELHKRQRRNLVRFEGDLETARRYIGESLQALYKAQGNTEATCSRSQELSRESVETTRVAPHVGEDIVRSAAKAAELARNSQPLSSAKE